MALGFVIAFSVTELCAQSGVLNKSVTGNYTQVTLKYILSDISKTTNTRFSYSPKKIPEDTKVTIAFNNTPLRDALNKLFSNLPIDFELVDDYIVLKKGETKKEEPAAIVHPKTYTLSGNIKDMTSGEFLVGATLYIHELRMGTTTNGYGFFSLSLPPGRYNGEISYLGYEPQECVIDLRNNIKFDFTLRQQIQKIEEVVISKPHQNEINFKKRASQTDIQPSFVAQEPSIMGEPDVIKALEFQPGIVFYGEGSSYFHVRGGNHDQNLIILDDAVIFSPTHMLGFFSPIIPDAIKSVDVYKADYPANFGGRLSSVIDIRTKDGNKNKFSASGNIGIISYRGTIEGPIKKDASSYFVSFRRSYFDAYLKPGLPSLQDLYFADFTSKMNLKLGSHDRLFFTLYNGKDIYRVKQGEDDSNGLDWKNASATIRWNHVFDSKFFSNITFCTSEYNYHLYSSVNNNTFWNSKISNLNLKNDVTWYLIPQITWKAGMNFSFYTFNPGNYYNPESENNIQVSPVNSSEFVLFTGAEQEVFPWLRINYGLRLTTWANYGAAFVLQYDYQHNPTDTNYYYRNEKYYTHSSLEPRISASLKTGKQSTLKVSYSRTCQYLNLITNSVSPFNSLEVWLPAGPNIKPQQANILDLGYVISLGSFTIQSDIYIKKMYNQIGYKYHANMLVNPALEGELRQGTGHSYGFEASLKKEKGKFSGSIDYTFSRTFLKINGLNNNRVYPATYDRPHNVAINIALWLRPRWLLTANQHIMSGMRVTTPTSFYYYQGYQVPVYTEQNNDRLPTYSRFDISTTLLLNKPGRKFNHSVTLAIVNFFNKKNPSFLYYNKTRNDEGNLVVPSDRLNQEDLISSARYNYGFIPSINYQFRF
jgi:hypothetical protein